MTDVTTTDTTASATEQDGGVVDEQLVTQLAERARAEGVDLDGEDGLLQRLTKVVVGSALEVSWTTTWATASTTRPDGMARTPVTARGPRRC